MNYQYNTKNTIEIKIVNTNNMYNIECTLNFLIDLSILTSKLNDVFLVSK